MLLKKKRMGLCIFKTSPTSYRDSLYLRALLSWGAASQAKQAKRRGRRIRRFCFLPASNDIGLSFARFKFPTPRIAEDSDHTFFRVPPVPPFRQKSIPKVDIDAPTRSIRNPYLWPHYLGLLLHPQPSSLPCTTSCYLSAENWPFKIIVRLKNRRSPKNGK